MKEIRYENENKVYVKGAAFFHPDGRLEPIAFWWEDGQRYDVQAKDNCPAASLKAGGVGIRYKCVLKNTINYKEIYLFLEVDRWFIERKGA